MELFEIGAIALKLLQKPVALVVMTLYSEMVKAILLAQPILVAIAVGQMKRQVSIGTWLLSVSRNLIVSVCYGSYFFVFYGNDKPRVNGVYHI